MQEVRFVENKCAEQLRSRHWLNVFVAPITAGNAVRGWEVELAKRNSLPDWICDGAIHGTVIARVIPPSGWNDFEAPFHCTQNNVFVECTGAGLQGFEKGCDSPDAKVDKKAQITFLRSSGALSKQGEWAVEQRNGDGDGGTPSLMLKIVWLREAPIPCVTIPLVRSAIVVDGSASQLVSFVEFRGLGVSNLDYAAPGFQSGFSASTEAAGFPGDAAVLLRGAADVLFSHCTFHDLGGGGIHATAGSRRLRFIDNRFERIGQSAILLSGARRARPTSVLIEGNMIDHPGLILRSGGGVLCSSCADTRILRNVIVGSARWGIHIRSGPSPVVGMPGDASLVAPGDESDALGIVIEQNDIRSAGSRTRDLGGISLIAYPGAVPMNATIRYNCIKNVGIDAGYGESDPDYATFNLPSSQGYGIYLDNFVSGCLVEGNVVAGKTERPLYIHWGGHNRIEANMFFVGTSVRLMSRVIVVRTALLLKLAVACYNTGSLFCRTAESNGNNFPWESNPTQHVYISPRV